MFTADLYKERYGAKYLGWPVVRYLHTITRVLKITRGSLAKKKIMFLHSKNKASRKGYKGEC